MSEHITHIAVYEDTVRIIKNNSSRFTPAITEALNGAYDSGMVCCGARGNHVYAVPIIEKNRELYGNSEYGRKEMEQVAGAIGWLLHRASDLEMKPMFQKVDQLASPVLGEEECEMYHDAVSFKNVYKGGKRNTESPYEYVDESLLAHQMETNKASKHMGMDYFEYLIAHNLVVQWVELCVFAQEMDDVNVFAEKLVDYSQDLYEDLRVYIRAFNNPEPYKIQGYINNFNIYNENDALIRYVRHVQENEEPHPDIDLKIALEDRIRLCRGAKRFFL